MSTLCDDLRMSILRSALNGGLSKSEEEWNECELGDLCEEITTGGAAPQGEKNFCNDGPCFVRVVDMGKLGVSKTMHETRDHLSESGIGKLKLFPTGTVLFTKSGASLLLNQRAILEKPMYVVSHIGCAIPKSIVSSDFLYLTLKGIDFNEYAHATSLPSLKISDLKKVAVKYPSLKQQKIIVEKVDELMARVADLEQSADALASLKKAFPDDIKASLLQAAMQGKLTKQLPEDGSAEDLLEEIKAEKEKLIAEGKIKKQKPLAPITDEEIPFNIPENWKWERFGNLGSYRKGPFGSALTKSIFVKDSANAIKVYEQKNAIKKDASLGDYYISREYYDDKMKNFRVLPGDIIVSCAGTIGETYILPEGIREGIINQALMRMRMFNGIYIPYFLIYFDYIIKASAISNSKGSAIKNIPPFEVLYMYPVAIPPLAEQKRIVERLNTFMQNINVVEDLIASE